MSSSMVRPPSRIAFLVRSQVTSRLATFFMLNTPVTSTCSASIGVKRNMKR
jgi:hypothetical protein